MVNYLKQSPHTLFFLFVVAFFFLNRFEQVTRFPPHSTHQWRQADCYSFALNYYSSDLPFLEPSVHFTGYNGNGRTISEFPVIYYTVAQIWKVTGVHPLIFRLIDFTLLLCGLFALFRLCNDLFKRPFLAIFITGLFASSPIVSYYGNSFIADIPALSLALCGWYVLSLFYKTEKQQFLYLSAFLFLFAALIKITSLISVVVIGMAWLLETAGLIRLKKDGKKMFAKPIWHVLPFALILVVVFFWVQYAKDYNAHNNQGIFLTGILPYWDASAAERTAIYTGFLRNVLFQYHSPLVLLVMLGFIVLAFVRARNNHPLVRVAFFVMLAGLAAFFVLFFRVFDVHDYYLSNWAILIPVVLISGFYIVDAIRPALMRTKWFAAVLAVVFVHSMYYGAALTRAKYFTDDVFSNMYLTFGQVQRPYYNWFHWNYDRTLRACETAAPYLREKGISPSDKVISIPDQSINISLALMNQPGFTDFGYNDLSGEQRIDEFIARGAKYLLINDPYIYEQRPYLQKYLTHKTGQYRNIDIYDLSSFKK